MEIRRKAARESPVRQVSLLFAGLAYDQPKYIDLWRKLNPDPPVE